MCQIKIKAFIRYMYLHIADLYPIFIIKNALSISQKIT